MFKKIKRITKKTIAAIRVEHIKRTEGYVVMLHRIGPNEPNRLSCLAELNVTPEYLQVFVDKHRERYDFISLNEVVERVTSPSKYKRPYIAFTFDDGFKDNLIYGLPFFEKNNIPFAVFVTVDFINRHPAFNYPFILERMIANNEVLLVDGIAYDCKTIEQKNTTFGILKGRVLSLPYENFENTFNHLFAKYIKPKYFEDLTMTWDEVNQLASSSLCTIGSHTMTHCRLSNLSEEQLLYELSESKHQLEEHIDKSINYISYPYGWKTDINDGVLKVSKSLYNAGFQSFMDVMGGGKNIMKINRIMIKE